MKNTVLKYGSIGGLIISFLLAGSWSFMADNMEGGVTQIFGYATMVIALSTIFVGIKNYRDNQLEGAISFRKAFLVGFYISLLASALYVVTWMIMYETIASDFLVNYIDAAVAKFEASGLTAEELEIKKQELDESMESYRNPIYRAMITLMEILPVGIIVSLIAAAILKKSK